MALIVGGETLRPDSADEQTLFISVVVPAYNEQETVRELLARLVAVVEPLSSRRQYLFVNDGSSDATLEVLRELKGENADVGIIDLSRNFGKEIAMSAGLDHAQGDVTVVIDADLQDPPELIPTLVAAWRRGYDVVYAKRTAREGEGALKRFSAFAFYRIIQKLSDVQIPEDTGDFRLLSRRAVQAMRLLRERNRFMKGLYAWIGYPQLAVEYRRDPRFAGKTKWNYRKLLDLAVEGITSFSLAPLRVASYLGFLAAIFAFAFGAYIVGKKIFLGDPVPGFPALMTMVSFLGGIQLIGIGVIGEYLGRTFDEVKHRPLYLVNEYLPSRASVLGDSALDHAGAGTAGPTDP